MAISSNTKRWAREEARAAAALAANRKRIESSAHVLPARRTRSRSTTASKGYVLITAKWGGPCIFCGRKITPGRQVRYWFDQGISCRSCPKGTEGGG